MNDLRPDQIDAAKTPILDVRMHPGKKQIRGALRYDPQCLLSADPLLLPVDHNVTL